MACYEFYVKHDALFECDAGTCTIEQADAWAEDKARRLAAIHPYEPMLTHAQARRRLHNLPQVQQAPPVPPVAQAPPAPPEPPVAQAPPARAAEQQTGLMAVVWACINRIFY